MALPQFFVDGQVRCPRCHRTRPMADLIGIYDAAVDSFRVKGIFCSACQYQYPEDSLAGLVRWAAWSPRVRTVPSYIMKPACPFCGRVTVEVPDGNGPRDENTREFVYHRCPDSPLVYRLAVEE